jgi:hypothetical protein
MQHETIIRKSSKSIEIKSYVITNERINLLQRKNKGDVSHTLIINNLFDLFSNLS